MEAERIKSDHFVKYQVCDSHMDRLYTPRRETRPDSLNDTKENRELGSSLHSHRKDQRWSKELLKESRRDQSSWCETPRLIRKDASLRRRLLVSRSSSDGRKSSRTTPADISRDLRANECFDSPDMSPAGPLTYSTLKNDDLEFSCRKRRLMFSQAITSTLETGRTGVHMSPILFKNQPDVLTEADLDESIIAGPPGMTQTNELTPLAGDAFQSPVKAGKHPERMSVLETPSLTPSCKLDTSASEDSGFSSLGLDKSHDSSVDHDGSFQELVLLLSSNGKEKRHSRLERQRRLSTLREGGSQSDDRPCGSRDQRVGQSGPDVNKDEVFLEGTPLSAATQRLEDLSLTPALQAVYVLSHRSTCVLQQQTSLEELLRVSEEVGPVRTTLPLSGLIGRKMGLDSVDVITELMIRNLRHVLAVILSLLSAGDIYRFGQVSDDWNEVVLQDKKASQRRRLYIRELKITPEAGREVNVLDSDSKLTQPCRPVLSSVQVQARTPHTPFTPTHRTQPPSSSKHLEFLQVAKTLFSDEFLKACPRCQHPARCHSLRGEGVCSWSDCGFRFCTSCLCAFHGSRDCAHLSAKRRSKRDVLPGSAQSKRNIRRL